MPALETVEVTGLLGHFHHEVHFPADDEFVILHGPNGVGKTHFLHLISAALGKRWWILRSIRFDRAKFHFDTGHSLEISREVLRDEAPAGPRRVRAQVRLSATFKPPKGRTIGWADDSDESLRVLESPARRYIEYELGFERIGPDDWYDPQSEQVFPTDEVLKRFLTDAARTPVLEGLITPLPAELDTFLAETPVKLVETQRLLTVSQATESPRSRGRRIRRSTVMEFARDLARVIAEKQAENSRIASQLDRTFPNRVFKRANVKTSDSALLERYTAQSALRDRLSEAALLDDVGEDFAIGEVNLESTERRVLATYLDDADRKLGVFGDTLERITLLRNIINERFLYKTIQIDAHEGFYFATDEGERLGPDNLSSGEQHELVLLYELLFRTDRGSLVLIDEPEISLHVKWQRAFLDDLVEIAAIAHLRFVIATHSPQVLGKWHSRANVLAPVDDDEG